MPKQEHTTRKQRKAIHSQKNIENVNEWLSSTKNEYQSITNAMEETGAVRPGNGLMLDQMPKISKEKYLSFINSTFVEALEGFGEDLSFEKGHDYVCINEFIITDSNDNKITVSNHKKRIDGI